MHDGRASWINPSACASGGTCCAAGSPGKACARIIVRIGPGEATLTMTVKHEMVNGARIAHGGFIFTLADSTFAFACNSHNHRAVAAQGDITFLRPGKLGDKLVATAREISRSGRSGICDVRVTVGDTVIAEFRGHSRTIPGTWLPVADTEKK